MNQVMIPSIHQLLFQLFLGFTISAVFVFSFMHPEIAYLGLLGFSAFLTHAYLPPIKIFFKRFSRYQIVASVAILSLIGSALIPSPASAQWNGARSAASKAFTPYINQTVIDLLFTAVFLLLFFLVVGGLATWGYKAFRNEEASIPMSAFIVGVVIYVGGDVFSNLFFTAPAGTPGGPAGPPSPVPPVGP